MGFCVPKSQSVGKIVVFHGVHNINMDAKGRLAIPARQRDPLHAECDGHVVITIDTIEVNPDLDPASFSMPAAPAEAGG